MIKKPRTKGAKGEREWAKELNNKFDVDYKRTPLSGGLDIKGDVRRGYGSKPSRVDDFCWEVKRQEKLNIYKALAQSTKDAKQQTPVVAHRRNNEPWMITMWADDFLNVLKELEDLSNE